LDSVAGELYGLVPSEFTPRRDALAAEARRGGDRELAATIKALRRPSAAAWLANALVRERSTQLAQLFELGEAMLEAQRQLAGADMRRMTQERHRLIAALADEARKIAGEAGESISPTAGKELEDTLAAAMLDAGAAEALRSGRLTAALHYSGLGPVDLTGSVAPSAGDGQGGVKTGGRPRTLRGSRGGAGSRTAPADAEETAARAKRAAAAELEVRQAEAAAAEAAEAAAGADRRASEARAERDGIKATMAEVRRHLEDLEDAVGRAEEEVQRAESEIEGADRARAAANERVSQARSALEHAG
jgi:hypothetical protein